MRRIRLTKKKILTLAIIVALFAIAAAGTLAYYTDEIVFHNIITTSAVDITLNEKQMTDAGLTDFPKGGIRGVMPGVKVSKIVSVTNEQADTWVRIRVTGRIEGPNGAALPMNLPDGTPVYTLDMTENTGWIQGTDGIWYYSWPLSADQTTDTLFESVTFAADLTNDYQNCTVYIDVTAQAVQYANNELPASGSPEDIPGWPEEQASP